MLYLTCSTCYYRPAASFSGSFGAVCNVMERSVEPHHFVELGKREAFPSVLCRVVRVAFQRLALGAKPIRDVAGDEPLGLSREGWARNPCQRGTGGEPNPPNPPNRSPRALLFAREATADFADPFPGSGVPQEARLGSCGTRGDHGPRGVGRDSGSSIAFAPPSARFPRSQVEGGLSEASRACALHCPFALTFACFLIFRRDNYRSDTLERSVIRGPPQRQRSPRSFSPRVPRAPAPSRPHGSRGTGCLDLPPRNPLLPPA